MKKVKVEVNQTIFDVAVQYYGTAEAAGDLLVHNPGLTNDPAALANQGIDYVANRDFYLDVPLLVGSAVSIDTQSSHYKAHIAKEITKSITTYGTNN